MLNVQSEYVNYITSVLGPKRRCISSKCKDLAPIVFGSLNARLGKLNY